MAPDRDRYRKLPGHRRGFLRSASLWLGSDHVLSVKSLRVREEYKRFHLRDVQAIVVASAPRFHFSTRACVMAWLWLSAFTIARNLESWVPPVLWGAAIVLVGAWFYVSYACSCTCRIFTAVSRDDLPSIYRTWTARKFLAVIEPRIAEAQGVLEGDWAEAVESRIVGPPSLATGPGDGSAPPRPASRRVTPVAALFVASLFADALLNILTLHSMTRTIQWVWYGLAFVQVGGAILIFVERHRGILSAGMQKLAIATLIAMGGAYYIRQVMAGVSASFSRPTLPDQALLDSTPGYTLLREVDAGVCLVLGIVGVILMLGGGDTTRQRSITG